jgi:cell division protein FtsL
MANKKYNRRYQSEYVYGSAAPAHMPSRETTRNYRTSRGYRSEQASRRAPGYRTFMDPALIGFMIAVVFAVSFFLIQYIGLQSDVTAAVKEIAQMESSLSDLKSNNDELENQINSSVNLDDIKYRAITKLGMTYAEEDQIVNYDGGSGDYVRQVTQLGQ